MSSWPGAPLTAAVELLALEARGASGVYRMGTRRLTLRRGRIAGVGALIDLDQDLADFLVTAGRLSLEKRASLQAHGRLLEGATARGDPGVVESTGLTQETLRESLRACWMERLARGFAEYGDASLAREPEEVAEEGYDVATLPLVLDALERRANDGDAEEVGARAQAWARFASGGAVGRAKRWAQIDAPREVRVASLLASTPAAAPRIAALARAGFLEIVAGARGGPPAPAPVPLRRSSRPPPPERPAHLDVSGLRAPVVTTTKAPVGSERPSVPPPRAPAVQLAPGATRVTLSLNLRPGLPELRLGDAKLDDPLDGPEDEVATLEAEGAPPAVRARAWRIVAEVARERLGALDEHARAAREAAAADPDDPEHLRRAADACAAIEETELALAYAKAAVGTAKTTHERARAMHDYALFCRRLGRWEEALQAARAAAQMEPEEPNGHLLCAEIHLALGRAAEAAHAFADGAEVLAEDDPARAHFFSARAYRADPRSPRAIEQFATALQRAGAHPAAIELRAERARLEEDLSERRRLLLVTAERAELQGTPLVSAALMLEVFDADPSFEVVWEPLETDLAEAGAHRERAIVLEEIALVAGDDASAWWAKAADARARLDSDGLLELELRTRALVERPDVPAFLEAVRALAKRSGRLDAWLGALDRAIRSPRADRATRTRLATRLVSEASSRPSLARWADRVAEHGAVPHPEFDDSSTPLAKRLDEVVFEPERRASVIARAREALARKPDAELARALLAAAHAEGDDAARADACGALAALSEDTIERVRLRILEAAFARFAGDLERTSAALKDAVSRGHADAEVGIRSRRLRTGEPAVDSAVAAAGWAIEAALFEGPLRARALAELACLDEASGRIERALELGARALAADPSCAKAALLLLRRDDGRSWTPRGEAFDPTTAEAFARLVEESPPSLRARALTTADPAEALARTVRWAALDSFSIEPLVTSLALSERHRLPEYDDAATEALCTPSRCEPAIVGPISAAIGRIASHSPKRAIEQSLRAAAALGPAGHALRALAFEIASVHRDREGLVRAAESQLAAPPGERATHLRKIAQLRREGNDLAGEARTWLRILAIARYDDEAIRRLAEIYAETGQRDRLVAVLSLRIEQGAPPQERVIGHLELAAVHARTLNEPEIAERHLAEAERQLQLLADDPSLEGTEERFERLAHALVAMGRIEQGVDLFVEIARRRQGSHALATYESALAAALRDAEHARKALTVAAEALERCGARGKLLLAFERIALDLRDVDAAERVYARLVARAVGAHGRRALAYRRARWLDRAGAVRRAIAAYVEASREQTSSGALLSSLEKLARAHGDLESLVRALTNLATNARHPTVRLALLRRAAAVTSEELGRPLDALALLANAWQASLSSELEADLVREASRAAALDRPRTTAIVRTLVDTLEARAAEAWIGEERARLFRKAARLEAEGLGELATAETYVWRAIEALRNENADRDTLLAPLEELAAFYRARGLEPDLARWMVLARREEGESTSPGASASEFVESLEPRAIEESSAATSSEPTGPASSDQPSDAEAKRSPALGPERDTELGSSAPRDADASSMGLEPTTTRGWVPAPPPPQPTRPEIDPPRASFVADPRRLDDIVQAAEHGTPAARRVARRILAACEPSPEDPLPLDAERLVATSLDLFRHPGLADSLAILRKVWEHGLPLFKISVREFGLLGTDRVGAHDTSPLGRAVRETARLLSLGDVTVYQSRERGLRHAEVLRTVPPSVRVSDGLARSPATLSFELARALELATPERVLLGTLAPSEGRNLFAAIRAAFGPATIGPEERSSPRDRETALLAADLWSTLPPLAQKSIHDMLVRSVDSFDYDSVARTVHAGAVRIGLVACAEPRCAVLGTISHDPALAGLEVRHRDALGEALSRSALLRDLVAFALSDGFLAALRT